STPMTQLAPAASVAGQLFDDTRKSAVLDRIGAPRAALGDPPVLLSVKRASALVAPSATLPRSADGGASTSVAMPSACPVSAERCPATVSVAGRGPGSPVGVNVNVTVHEAPPPASGWPRQVPPTTR